MTKKPDMFYGASPGIFERAKMLRQNMTKQEKMLWEEVRGNRIMGLRFKAQHPISTFIADFYCHKIKLVVEIDGDSHNSLDQKSYDEGRNDEMLQLGITTLRFSNEDIETRLREVLSQLTLKCKLLANSAHLSIPTLSRALLMGEDDMNLECKSPLKGVEGKKKEENA